MNEGKKISEIHPAIKMIIDEAAINAPEEIPMMMDLAKMMNDVQSMFYIGKHHIQHLPEACRPQIRSLVSITEREEAGELKGAELDKALTECLADQYMLEDPGMSREDAALKADRDMFNLAVNDLTNLLVAGLDAQTQSDEQQNAPSTMTLQ